MNASNRNLSTTRPATSSAAILSRLGGIAGLLGVLLGVAQALQLAPSGSAIELILVVLSNLVVILWLVGAYAFQSSRLGRLGRLGWGSLVASLAFIILFNLLGEIADAGPGEWVNILEASPATPVVFTVMIVAFVWGVLAFGTASLQAGVLPRGSVVLWMFGMMASLVSSWTPIALATSVGVIWSSIILLRGLSAQNDSQLLEVTSADTTPHLGRYLPLDALRGIIMILMAIDHASYFIRRWHPFETWDQPLPEYPGLAALLTRLVTHPCAPGFFFLMGAGMILLAHSRRQIGWSERQIAGHLALRGLLLITLEQLVVDVASAGKIYPLEFSILSGLGAVMIFGILFLRLSGPALAAAGAAIVLIMQFLPSLLLDADLGIFTPIRLLLVPGSVGAAYVLYAPIPWLGVALLGMAFARLLLQDQEKAYRVAAVAGLACLALFPVVRLLGGFGNLRMPPGDTLIDFLNLVKYPPSLSFLLLALGLDLVALYLLSRASAILVTWGRPVVVLGQAALYFFLVHWFIYGAMGLVWSEPGGLPKTYLAWATGLILLYPVCKTYEAFKHSMPANSVWRML